MKVYNKVENNANIADNAYSHDTTKIFEDDEPGHNMQIICYIMEEKNDDKNHLINIEVYKSITRNVIKRLKM